MSDFNILQETINVNLNSLNAILEPSNPNITYLSTYLSNVKFNFPSLLRDDISILYSAIQVLNAQIPVSYYQINYTNNSLKLLLVGGSSLNTTLTLTRGNYNIVTLMAEISNQFALLSIGSLTCSFNKISGLLTMILLSATYNISFSVLPSSISKVIGFASTLTYISSGLSLTAPFPVSLLTIKKLKVCSTMLSTQSLDSNNLGTINLLNTIPVNAPAYSIITYENKQPYGPILRNKIIDYIDIQILDDNNNFVNFNNVDWTITLSMTIFRKREKNSNNQFSDLTDPILKLVETLKNNASTVPLAINPINTTTNNTPNNPPNNTAPLPFTDENDLDFYMYKHGIIL